jgi:hypothetical protein
VARREERSEEEDKEGREGANLDFKKVAMVSSLYPLHFIGVILYK